MNKIIEKMRYTDMWSTNDTCKVLAENNIGIGNEFYFRDLLYSAQKAKKIKPHYIPPPSITLGIQQPNYELYNYEYNREDIINWIILKQFVLPTELNPPPSQKKNNKISTDTIESTNMNIIAMMLEAMLGHGANGVKNSRFEKQTAIITYIINKFSLEGASQRTLEQRFAEANKILEKINIIL
jgi:hypothetical protein